MILGHSGKYILAYGAALFVFIALLLFAARFIGKRQDRGPLFVVAANVLMLLLAVFLCVLVAEGYYGFVYDETDAYGLLLTSQRWFARNYHFNNGGFRDDNDYTIKKAANVRRIVFIGDSFTAGHGIRNIDDRFTGIIKARLKQERRDPYEVYTLAVNGWDTEDELRYLAQFADAKVDADIVVLCYCMNDIATATPESEALFNLAPRNWLLRRSFFLNFLYVRFELYRHSEFKDYYGWLAGYYAGPQWGAEKARLKEFAALCKKRGWALRVVILPLIDDLSRDFKMREGHARLAALFKEMKIPFIDLSDRLKEYPAQQLVVNKFDAHPNEFAHSIIGEEIWNRLPLAP